MILKLVVSVYGFPVHRPSFVLFESKRLQAFMTTIPNIATMPPDENMKHEYEFEFYAIYMCWDVQLAMPTSCPSKMDHLCIEHSEHQWC